MHGAEPAVFIYLLCCVYSFFVLFFLIFFFVYFFCFVLFFLFVHCTFVGSCAVVNVR